MCLLSKRVYFLVDDLYDAVWKGVSSITGGEESFTSCDLMLSSVLVISAGSKQND